MQSAEKGVVNVLEVSLQTVPEPMQCREQLTVTAGLKDTVSRWLRFPRIPVTGCFSKVVWV